MKQFRDDVGPEELTMIQRVFDEYCSENGVKSIGRRDEVAAGLLSLFRNGIAEERLLSVRLRRLLAR